MTKYPFVEAFKTHSDETCVFFMVHFSDDRENI